MYRSAPRLTRILACAAVPVMLVVAGCSSDSDSKSTPAKENSPAAASPDAAKATPKKVEPATYAKLPDACKAIAAKTIEDMVPDVKTKSGTPGKSSDIASRSSCSWNGLEDKGIKGSNYRWLDVSLLRYDSDPSLGSGEERAKESFDKEVAKVQATQGATAVRTSVATGVGDQATAVSYGLKKTGEDFKYAAIVTRTENAVITLSYNGAGYAGAKTPDPNDLMEDAVKAAKEAVAAVATANK
ncbi:DUF3558 family protein [Streptomyces sp. NRRL S-118]|uniref:DUF3558 family protein n=1 Tax=Streptomyces sp. NRRL S-118 TaxID=1463881 RepID=UPI0004C773EF|nr:DUF3558 family protein [Streptomyces sp. NRRL S-118]